MKFLSNTKFLLLTTVSLWASAFVGIRAGLESYSPGGLALFRFIIASTCVFFIYHFRSREKTMPLKDILRAMLIGVIGIGLYNFTLNSGELSVPSGPACFIVSQSPVISTLLALFFLGERLNFLRIIGMLVSVGGVTLIAAGINEGFTFNLGLFYILVATVVGCLYTIFQKPLLKKYHAIDVTAYAIWGGTLSLVMYAPELPQAIMHATVSSTIAVIYLGIFPAAIAYVLWGMALAKIPASRAVSFLYFSPIIATLLGWIWLNEIPMMLSVLGGLVALLGVWVVNRSYVSVISIETNIQSKSI